MKRSHMFFNHKGNFLHRTIFFNPVCCTDKLNMKLINPLQCVSMRVSETAVLSVNITINKNSSKTFKYFSDL